MMSRCMYTFQRLTLKEIWLEPAVRIAYMYGFSAREEKQILGIISNNVVTFKKNGMNISHNKFDPIETLIFEEGLRIKSLEISGDLNKITIYLNNNHLFIAPVDLYKGLKNAGAKRLNNFEFIGGGTGIHWPDLDEDLSLKGFLKEFLRQTVKNKKELVIS